MDPSGSEPLRGLKVIDVGCGGGLLCEVSFFQPISSATCPFLPLTISPPSLLEAFGKTGSHSDWAGCSQREHPGGTHARS